MKNLTLLLVLYMCTCRTTGAQNCITADAGPDKQICSPITAVILGTPGVPGASYSWSPVNGLNNPSIAQPVASPSSSATYTLTVTSGQNILPNGDFENGFSSFGTDYGIFPATDGSCAPTTNSYGSVSINTNTTNLHPFWCSMPDHSPAGTNMLIVDGSAIPGHRVWFTTIPVLLNSTYSFSGWVSAISGTPAQLRVQINGVPVLTGYTLPLFCGNWSQFSMNWNSGNSTTALIEIFDDNLNCTGNDFCLDDLAFSNCPAVTDQVNVCVCQQPQPQTIIRKIPILSPFLMYKFNPSFGQYCFSPGRDGYHGHYLYENNCGGGVIMSGYMNADNNLPSYQSADIQFNMFPRNSGTGGTPVLWIPAYGNITRDHFIPANDIINAQLYLFHYNAAYPTCRDEWPLHEFNLQQAHSGNNSFSITRSTHIYDSKSCAHSTDNFTPLVNYDNPPQAFPSDVINVPGPGNSNQDFILDVTQMTKNSVTSFTTGDYYLGFQIKQLQTNTYNNVLFQGLMYPYNTNTHPYPGESYIELTYLYRPPAIGCATYKSVENSNTPEVGFYYPDSLTTPSPPEVKIIPNPASSQITINSSGMIISAEIYNITGMLLKKISLQSQKNISININDLRPGYYFIKVATDKGIKYLNFLLQR